jgi:hypothetical protein
MCKCWLYSTKQSILVDPSCLDGQSAKARVEGPRPILMVLFGEINQQTKRCWSPHRQKILEKDIERRGDRNGRRWTSLDCLLSAFVSEFVFLCPLCSTTRCTSGPLKILTVSGAILRPSSTGRRSGIQASRHRLGTWMSERDPSMLRQAVVP